MTEWLDRRSAPLIIGLLAGAVAIAAALLVGASSAEQALLAARWTARTALPVFLVAYLASSLMRLAPGAVSRALMRRRRQWGLGFAIAHSVHLAALAVNVLVFGPARPWQTLMGGAFAYLLILLMAVTSNDASVRRLGSGWRWLHRIGIHYIWLVFFISYAGRLAEPAMRTTGLIFTPLLVAALTIRLLSRRARGRHHVRHPSLVGQPPA